MTNRLACDRADRFAAIAPAAGTLGVGVPCQPTRPVSVLAIHGTDDPVVPFDGGRMIGRGGASTIVSAPDMAARWRSLDDCPEQLRTAELADPGDGTRVEQTFAEGCRDGTEVVFDQVDGGGHTWPGGWQYLPVAVIGRTSKALDASEASWAFFAAHHR